ncbi:fused signal recognition particle receptor [Octadecabacter temperatus]|uniref:Signal recognition particle receptor FtsY n=1 Tax=Octadecabacter temperatus TaxID=1458307 RepID=A0A0K0Y3Q1_9RHOB|nr:Signal recognition particle receptor FtsY [Octadecabacter temperatus]SIN94564.1 fused signal recognition particle receptor [Octadecabacter temperatus]
MAFFKKLKDRLFKSSSKIEEGLDAIIEDGGVEEEIEAVEPDDAAVAEAQAAEEAQAALAAEEAARVEAARVAEVEREQEAARLAEEERAREAALKAEELAKAEREAEAARQEEARKEAEIEQREAEARAMAEQAEKERQAAEEAARIAAEKAQAEADAKAIEEAKAKADAAEVARLEAERLEREQAAQAAEAERLAQEAERAEAARVAEAARLEEVARQAEAKQLAEDARRAEEAQQASEAREAELARQAQAQAEEEAKRAEELQRAEAARKAEEERLEAERAAQEKAAKPGLLGRLLGRGEKKTVVRRELDDDMLERLEELLISADMGVDTALRVTSNMAEGRFGKRLSTQEIKELLAGEITRIMEPVARPMPLYPTKPQVVLVVGVNGSGKTTTIGKLASQFQAAGKKVVIAAGDTFRAAAVEQLQVWGDRAGVPVLTAPEGSDPASLAFEAMEQAARDGADLLMIDTAGRLQNRSDLMEELQKIVRVIRKKDPDAPHNTLLVLDATTGQNALSQVKTFQELADVSGLVMTKLDGTAKGGVLVALADKFGLPIHAIGVGEQIDDLAPFDPEEFAAALTGLEL